MKNPLISISIITLLITAGFLGFITLETEVVRAGKTVYVGTGVGNSTTSIQDAIDNYADPGDTVYVYSGIYTENVIVNKTINLKGENKETTIIDGGGSGDVVYISAAWVNMSGFTVRNGGGEGGDPFYDAGIELCGAQNCIIYDNNVSNNGWHGIYLYSSSKNYITNNYLSSNSRDGIHLRESSNNIITNNNASMSKMYGVHLYYSTKNIISYNNFSNNWEVGIVLVWNSNHNIITNNNASKQGTGLSITGGSYNLIAANTVISIDSNGINLGFKGSGSKYNIIANNYITSCNGYGIYLFDSSFNQIINNTVYNCFTGIYLDGDGDIYASKNNTIANNNVSWNHGHGIHLMWASDTNITNNDVSNNQEYGIYLQVPLSPKIVNLITYNNVSYNLEGIYIETWGCLVGGNYVFKNKRCGITLIGSRNDNVTDNNVFSNRNDGIYLHSSEYVDITNNNVWKNINGIHIFSSSNDNITNNNVSKNVWNGIFLDSAINAKVTKNDFTDDGVFIKGQNVLEFFNSHTITDDNLVNGEPLYYYKNSSGLVIDGISVGELILANCTDFVAKNLEINSTDVGIEVACSSNINITNNNVSSNNYGFYLCLSSNNSITSNNVYSNKVFGIHLTTSWDNSIYHNYIINNPIQAYDDRNDNLWNDSYPSGGNYWSDFNEPNEGAYDNFKGPDQNISGGDGIVDLGPPSGGINPYVIDSDSQDVYPLIDFEGNYLFLFEGWNLISLPFIQTDTDLETVLQSIEGAYDTVEWYDIGDSSDYWKVYNTYKPSYLVDLHDLDHKMGFWIHVTKPGGVLFEYFGSEPTVSQNIMLYPGWNIVGYPSLSNKNRTSALNNIIYGTDVDSIWTWDGAKQKWEAVGDTDYFEVGRGYWVYSNVEKVWDVPL